MKITLDITKIDLSCMDSPLDTYDGKTIFFDIPTRLPNKIVFDIWGVSINKNVDWLSYGINFETIKDKFDDNSDIAIIKGFGKFTINEIVACRLKISPILETNNNFLFEDGKIISFERSWNLDKINDYCFKYFFDVNIYFPYGNIELEIYTKGSAFFSFDSDDLVKYVDYLSESKDNSFKGFLKEKSIGISFTNPLSPESLS
jgi:hypothetical protein